MRVVEGDGEVVIDAPASTVWEVLTVPALAAVLDARITLVEFDGEPGIAGSSYVIDVKATSVHPVRQKIVVRESNPFTHLVCDTLVNDRRMATQTAAIHAEGPSTRLVWRAEIESSWLMSRMTRAHLNHEIPKWLEAVATLALARA